MAESEATPLARRRAAAVLVSIFLIALCGIIYELLLGTTATYLLGNSIKQFSFTLGLFLAAMGIGSYVSRFIEAHLMDWFVWLEILLSLAGGCSTLVLLSVFAWYRPAFQPLLFVWLMGLGICIGMEIPLLTRILNRFGNLRVAIADALSLDYVGGLAASLAFPLVLYPSFGLLRTAVLAGAINLAVVLLNLRLFRPQLGRFRAQVAGAVAVGIVLLLVFVRAGWLLGWVEERVFRATVVHAVRSPYQKSVLTRRGSNPGDLRMWINGKLQFSSLDEYRYHEPLVHPAMALARDPRDVLILGGGDGLAARELLKFSSVRSIHLVDLDPAITRMAREHPLMLELNGGSLDHPSVTIEHADAYVFLERNRDSFDVILADLPDPGAHEISRLYSVEAYRLMRRALRPGGVMVTQATSPVYSPRAFWCIAASMEAAGLETLPFHNDIPSFGPWGFVMGSHEPLEVARLEVTAPTRYLTTPVAHALFELPKDIRPVPVEVNRWLSPTIVRYYEEDWDRWNPSGS